MRVRMRLQGSHNTYTFVWWQRGVVASSFPPSLLLNFFFTLVLEHVSPNTRSARDGNYSESRRDLAVGQVDDEIDKLSAWALWCGPGPTPSQSYQLRFS